MSIKDNLSKIKPLWITMSIILIVSVGAFGLGRLSVLGGSRTPIILGVSSEIIEKDLYYGQKGVVDLEMAPFGKISPEPASIEGEGIVVGSKNGTTYHFPWCSGAKRIIEENKVVFASQAEAKKAGYVPAKNCKGLITDPQ